MRYTVILLLVLASNLFAQNKKTGAESTAQSPSIASKVSGMAEYLGFFNFYYDVKQDKIHLLIDKLNVEFLYVPSLTAGIGSNDIGLDRNQLGRERIVKFERRGPK